MTTATAIEPGPGKGWPLQLGRSFVHPLFDYLVIAGGLSLLVTAVVFWQGPGLDWGGSRATLLAVLILISNSAHFAASTVRLYTKPGAFRDLPFLTLGLPIATVAMLTLTIAFAPLLGRHLQALYLTWSPYHYAAQAYGLAAMYCYRSGCRLEGGDKVLLRLACLAPFLHSFLGSPTIGIEWFVPASALGAPAVAAAREVLVRGLAAASLALPAVWFVVMGSRGRAVPAISLLVVLTNGVWWIALNYVHAFFWATVFHGLQYLAIVIIFHVRDRERLPGNLHGWAYHSALFYLACLLLGFLLFQVWPFAYVAAGFGWAESLLLVTAVINIHHFVVDAYIWRLRRDPNYRIVTETVPAA
jgi:hypothetical protein